MGISEVLHKQHLSAPSVMEDTGVPSHEATNFCLTTRVVYRLAQRPRRRECCGCVRLNLWYHFTAIQRVERLPLAVPEGSQLSQIFALRSEYFDPDHLFKMYFLHAHSDFKCHISVLLVANSSFIFKWPCIVKIFV
jgi:hypothetical protein